MVDKYLEEDINNIINSNIPLDELANSTIFVTGATGLIGSLLIRTFIRMNKNIHIIALIRNEDKAKDIFEDDYNKITFIVGDIRNEILFDERVDFIYHCASVTTSKTMVEYPVETLTTSVQGTINVLELAKQKRVKSVVYVSSMEVYGTFMVANDNVTEDQLGYIDPLRVRSNYPESKRLCENICVAYLNEFNVPVKIARLAQTFGAGILKGENRVFAQFARSAINKENIILHTDGLSEGNYCYTSDAIKALLILLVRGENGQAYNISNPDTHTTIVDMAYMVCKKIANDEIKVIFDIPETNTFGYAAPTKMKLNSDKMQQLGWKPEVCLKDAFIRLIGSILNNNLC